MLTCCSMPVLASLLLITACSVVLGPALRPLRPLARPSSPADAWQDADTPGHDACSAMGWGITARFIPTAGAAPVPVRASCPLEPTVTIGPYLALELVATRLRPRRSPYTILTTAARTAPPLVLPATTAIVVMISSSSVTGIVTTTHAATGVLCGCGPRSCRCRTSDRPTSSLCRPPSPGLVVVTLQYGPPRVEDMDVLT